MQMLIKRSGYTYQGDNNNQDSSVTHKKEIDISKDQLIQTCKEYVVIRESELMKLIVENVKADGESELEGICLKQALMKVGFVPDMDDSVNVFYEELDLNRYDVDVDVQQYLPYFKQKK
jgi:hypothetical protein